jgi:hypothetical protein
MSVINNYQVLRDASDGNERTWKILCVCFYLSLEYTFLFRLSIQIRILTSYDRILKLTRQRAWETHGVLPVILDINLRLKDKEKLGFDKARCIVDSENCSITQATIFVLHKYFVKYTPSCRNISFLFGNSIHVTKRIMVVTAAVKLARNWIGCDLSMFPFIHIDIRSAKALING